MRGEGRVLLGQHLLPDRQGPYERRFRLREPAASDEEQPKVAQGLRHVRVIGTQDPFANRERLPDQRLGLLESSGW